MLVESNFMTYKYEMQTPLLTTCLLLIKKCIILLMDRPSDTYGPEGFFIRESCKVYISFEHIGFSSNWKEVLSFEDNKNNNDS